MSRFISEYLKNLKEYVPGEQPRDKKYIKLNTNEAAYPVSEQVAQVISQQSIENLNLYSDPDCRDLTTAFANLYNVREENLIFGNGSDEILALCFMAYFQNGEKVVFPDISYGFYKVFAELYRSDYEEIPLNEQFEIDPTKYQDIHKGVVIANPNAPTGLALSRDDIEKIVATNPDHIVVIDEAYVDFGGQSVYPLCEKYKNLIVTGTFSKSRSLAGARLGFAIADVELIGDLQKIRFSNNPYNINRLTQEIAVAVVKDNAYFMENCKKTAKCREHTKAELEKMGFTVLDSATNFLFAKHDAIGGEELYLKLKEKGILIRHFNVERIKDFNRITIGTPNQMEMFLTAVRQCLQ